MSEVEWYGWAYGAAQMKADFALAAAQAEQHWRPTLGDLIAAEARNEGRRMVVMDGLSWRALWYLLRGGWWAMPDPDSVKRRAPRAVVELR